MDRPPTAKQPALDPKQFLLFKAAFDNSNEGISVFNQAGEIILANKKAGENLGISSEKLVGMSLSDIFHTDEAEQYYADLQEVFSSGIEKAAEIPARINGDIRWFKFHLKPFSEAQGEVHLVFSHMIEITESKLLIDLLNESAVNLKILLENSHDLILISDKDRRIILFNDAVQNYAMTTQDKELFPGMKLDEISKNEREHKIWTQMHQRVLNGETFREEINLEFPDGEQRYFETSFQPFYQNDEIIGFSEFTRDITERKLAELALAESEEHFRQLAENINEVFWICTPDWSKILYISPAYEHVWGISCESLYQDASEWSQVVLKEDLPKLQAELDNKIDGDLSDPYFPEYRIRRPDGSIRWISARSFPIHDEEGQVIRIAGIAEDITERKLTEDAIRRSEARYRKLFNTMLNGFVLYEILRDEDGTPFDFRVIQANRAFEEITNLKVADVVGKTQREIFEAVEPFWMKTFIEVATTGISAEVQNYSNTFDKYIHMYAYRPELNQFAIIFTDVSKEVRAEQELQNLNEELEQRVIERTQQLERKNKDMESFSYSVSHDLRAPLRAISGFGQILIDDYADGWEEEPVQFLQLMVNAGQKMDALIDGLLALSRISQVGLNIERINLSELARQAFDILFRGIRGREINFEFEQTPDVMGDPRLMEAVLTNLLSNAIKFTQEKAVAQITFGHLKENDLDVFFVKDNGVGFSMEYKEKLFAPFQRFDSREIYEGTGIGLTIVKQIIERHNGAVWAESQIEVGTTFYFHLGPGNIQT